MKLVIPILLTIVFMCTLGMFSIGVIFPDGTTFELDGWLF